MSLVLTEHLQFESIMANHQQPHRTKSAQRGITLFESLIALLVLALGVLGLAAVQARMLVETRTTNSRATAIRLIADLSDRIRLNKVGAQPIAVGGNSPYSDNAPATFATPPDTVPPAAGSCNPTATTPCLPSEQVAYDLWAWRTMVNKALMNGQASVYQVSPQQLQVTIAWQLNEIKTGGVSTLANPLQVTDGGLGNICSTGGNFICHVDFIDLPTNQ